MAFIDGEFQPEMAPQAEPLTVGPAKESECRCQVGERRGRSGGSRSRYATGGTIVAYPQWVDRYRVKATACGFKGHMAMVEAMT